MESRLLEDREVSEIKGSIGGENSEEEQAMSPPDSPTRLPRTASNIGGFAGCADTGAGCEFQGHAGHV
eukprot:3569736-Pyramimonas_sp.AAC.1